MKRSNFLKSLVGIVAGATILPKVVLGNEKVTDDVLSKTKTVRTSVTGMAPAPVKYFKCPQCGKIHERHYIWNEKRVWIKGVCETTGKSTHFMRHYVTVEDIGMNPVQIQYGKL